MSRNAKIAAGGVAAGLILLIWLPWWASLLIILGVPAAAYLALDPPSGAGSAAPHAGSWAADGRGATGGWQLSQPSPSSC